MGFMDNATDNAVKKFGVVTEGKYQNRIMTMDNGAGKGGNTVLLDIVHRNLWRNLCTFSV